MRREEQLRWAERGRVVGVVALAVGLFASVAAATWAGVALIVAAMAVITVVRVRWLRTATLTPTERTRLAASWTLFALALSAFLVVAVPGELVAGEGRLFWALAAVSVATLVAYRVFRAAYSPDDEESADGEGKSAERVGSS